MILLQLVFSDDLDCLRKLYKSANGDEWANNTNWKGSDYCQFYGVKCDSQKNVI